MLRRLIIFLIRKKLGVKEYVTFRFTNQKSDTDFYYFTDCEMLKYENGYYVKSNVSLNWLLDERCELKDVMPLKERLSEILRSLCE